jgi:hypothetical protein
MFRKRHSSSSVVGTEISQEYRGDGASQMRDFGSRGAREQN